MAKSIELDADVAHVQATAYVCPDCEGAVISHGVDAQNRAKWQCTCCSTITITPIIKFTRGETPTKGNNSKASAFQSTPGASTRRTRRRSSALSSNTPTLETGAQQDPKTADQNAYDAFCCPFCSQEMALFGTKPRKDLEGKRIEIPNYKCTNCKRQSVHPIVQTLSDTQNSNQQASRETKSRKTDNSLSDSASVSVSVSEAERSSAERSSAGLARVGDRTAKAEGLKAFCPKCDRALTKKGWVKTTKPDPDNPGEVLKKRNWECRTCSITTIRPKLREVSASSITPDPQIATTIPTQISTQLPLPFASNALTGAITPSLNPKVSENGSAKTALADDSTQTPLFKKRKRSLYGATINGINRLARLMRSIRESTPRDRYEKYLSEGADDNDTPMRYRPSQKRKTRSDEPTYLKLDDVQTLTGIDRGLIQTIERPPEGKAPNWYVLYSLLNSIDYIRHPDGTPYLVEELMHITMEKELPCPALTAAVNLLYAIAYPNPNEAVTGFELPTALKELAPTGLRKWESITPIGKTMTMCEYRLENGILTVTPKLNTQTPNAVKPPVLASMRSR